MHVGAAGSHPKTMAAASAPLDLYVDLARGGGGGLHGCIRIVLCYCKSKQQITDKQQNTDRSGNRA